VAVRSAPGRHGPDHRRRDRRRNDNTLPPDPEQADPNLYQNLDFYGWLAANDSQPPTH